MGFSGIKITQRRGAASKPVIGFRGIVIELDLNLPIRVVDQRGRGVANATVVISNPDTTDLFQAFTDSQGNCLVNEDGSASNPITVTKDRVTTTVNYTTGASLTIVMDMMKNKPTIL